MCVYKVMYDIIIVLILKGCHMLNSLNIPMWIILIPLIIILFYKVSVCKEGNWQEKSLGLSHSKDLLGYFAIMIVVHHTVQNLIQNRGLNVGIMTVFENMGVCFVGAFFFFSGYGLVKSYLEKVNYLDGFFKKRILKIIIPFYVVNTFFVIIFNMMGYIEKQEMPLCITGIFMANDHMWYLVEIVLLYSLFYYNFTKSKSEEEAFLKMFAEILAIIIISLLIGHGPFWFQGEWWYNSTLLFFIGMVISRFDKTVISFVKRNYSLIISVTAVLFFIFHHLTLSAINSAGYWTEYEDITWIESLLDKVQTLTVQIPMIICFVFLVLLLGLKIKTGNKVLSFLGDISLEIYITHRLFIILFGNIKSPFVYISLVLIFAVILGAVFHKIDNLAIKYLPKAVKLVFDTVIRLMGIVFTFISDSIKRKVKIKKYSTWGIIFISPFLIFYGVFSLIPLLFTIVNSFFENYRSGIKQIGPTFIGLANYQKLFSSGDFWKYFGNTLLIWILVFIPQILISLILAYWFSDKNLKIRGASFYKTVIYLPGVLMASAMASFFNSMFSTVGPINNFMVNTLKIWKEPVEFFSRIATTRGLIVFMTFLMSFGSSTLLLMAGMMSIDASLYEAAKVDGAKSFVVFRKITLPLIRPVFIFVVITSLISGMQLFDVPEILNGGNPVRTSFTMVMYLRNNLYSSNYGMSGAISTLMLFVTGVLSAVVFWIYERGENK